ncbi:pseudaminic acid synthase [Psychrobacter sp. P2G3]|uniref:pseudaminic acid synthase n=1 Tax=Psychrobacter sp. P2G3 TaxID=1699622 RepID=UPI00078C51FE|nr:pseudaminic acid synthase [Psychrobacter sp. P2G3]AMN48596.1 N-acetylneuraminate synthase [Psychrobacter sp. P2G3]
MNILGRKIDENHPPYIIAEMSANHNGSIDNAKKIISEAKNCGADAVKLQTYSAETITIKSDRPEFLIKEGLWEGQTLFDLYKSAEMPWDWHKPLFEHAKEEGITIFSSPFDFTAVDLLEDLNTPAYKIASFEAIDIPLIKYVASTKKPMIISTGMANLEEVEEAIEAAKTFGCQDLVILHCVSGYPADPRDYNLKTILDMQKRFGVMIGLSDHTISNTTAIASVALGVKVIEKHFTMDRNGGGADDSFSLEPQDLRQLCSESKIAWEALGKVSYGNKGEESKNLQFRRSLYVVKDIEKGERFTSENVRSIRPGLGLKPKFYDKIIGSKSKTNIEKGTPLSKDLIC